MTPLKTVPVDSFDRDRCRNFVVRTFAHAGDLGPFPTRTRVQHGRVFRSGSAAGSDRSMLK